MKPDDSPFPCHWWGIGLEIVGLESVRPDVGTYGRYDFKHLPRLPFEMRGELDWLSRAPSHDSNIGNEKANENAQAILSLRECSERLGIPLPRVFTAFMETPSLHERIRSTTDCYLDLCPSLVESPIGEGFLIRFLADSQGCIFWYVHLTRNGSDHAVVSSPGFYGSKDEQWQEEEPDPREIVFSAESFEVFLCRFWIENEIWFAEYDKVPMPDFGTTYLEQYRSNL